MNFIASNAAKVLQKLPFVDRLFEQENMETNSDVVETVELQQEQRPVVANKLLDDLVTDLAQKTAAAASLTRLAVRRIRAFKIEALIFECDLKIGDGTVAEPEGSKAILRLLQSDNSMQQALTEASKAMMQVEDQMVAVDSNVQRLIKEGKSPSTDVMEWLQMELDSSIKELKKSKKLSEQAADLVNWNDPPAEPNELQAKVSALTPEMENILNFPLAAAYSAETMDFCTKALALHLEKSRTTKNEENETEMIDSLDEWSKWSEKVMDTVQAEERCDMHTIMHERNFLLRIVTKKLNLNKLEQLKEMLEHQVLGAKQQNSTPSAPPMPVDPIITAEPDTNSHLFLVVLLALVWLIKFGLTSNLRIYALLFLLAVLVMIVIFWDDDD